VVHVEELGEARVAHTLIGKGRQQVAVRMHSAQERVKAGGTMRLRLPRERLHLFDAEGRRVGE
jgi:ABC-type sugar transport system ATPase subunit